MVDDVPKSKENHEAGHNGPQKKRAIRPFLKVGPKHFFSRKFDMDVITDKSKRCRKRFKPFFGYANLFLNSVCRRSGAPVLFICMGEIDRAAFWNDSVTS